MPYRLSGREVGTILLAIYEKYQFIADQLEDPSPLFPVGDLEHWWRTGAVSREVSSGFFSYYNREGEKLPYNRFVFGRLRYAIEKGGDTYQEIFETAVYGPLRKPDTFAMRVTEMNTKSYLMALGGNDLICDHFPILQMLLAYHQNTLHPLVLQTGELDPREYVTTCQGLASEFYHRIGKGHDWQAITHFLVNETQYQGAGMNLLTEYGNIEVYKVPQTTACDGCKALYLENNRPKVFRINDLLQNGTATISQRTGDVPATVPTCGPSHIWCGCSHPCKLTGMEEWLKKESPVRPTPSPSADPKSENTVGVLTPGAEGFISRVSKFLSQFCEK